MGGAARGRLPADRVLLARPEALLPRRRVAEHAAHRSGRHGRARHQPDGGRRRAAADAAGVRRPVRRPGGDPATHGQPAAGPAQPVPDETAPPAPRGRLNDAYSLQMLDMLMRQRRAAHRHRVHPRRGDAPAFRGWARTGPVLRERRRIPAGCRALLRAALPQRHAGRRPRGDRPAGPHSGARHRGPQAPRPAGQTRPARDDRQARRGGTEPSGARDADHPPAGDRRLAGH